MKYSMLVILVSAFFIHTSRIFASLGRGIEVPTEITADVRTLIEFPSEIFVSKKSQYSLFDLTDVKAKDINKLEATRKIFFDFSPYSVDPGVQRNLEKHSMTQKEVVELLKKNSEFNSEKYHLKIPQKVVIQVFTEKILAIEVERKIKSHLNALCNDCRFRISLSKMPAVKSAQWEIDFSNLKERGSFLLSIVGEGSWVSGFVKTEKPVLVAQKDIQAGENLQAKDFSLEFIDITYLKDYLIKKDLIENTMAVGNISAFSPLTTRQMKRKPDVIRGQQVQVFTGDAQLEISAMGISEQEGIVGEVIRLKLVSNQKQITAEVIQKGIVKIQ
ncbi:MAG: flagellar basal body P-ring formation chaperone FlgA [Pseudobdellovibrionaceae bacterium]